MWSVVATYDTESRAPSARAKHTATLVGEHIYLLGGRNGNIPLKDFWRYNLVTGKWEELKPAGDRLPCLQEHTAVAYKNCIYVFGGEVGFSAGTETPLWVYSIKENLCKKLRTKKGVPAPKGRRGHSALIYNNVMLIYGGYQDLKGSSGELWKYNFESESWQLVSNTPSKENVPDGLPPPRHKHSAVLHNNCLWVYGGMTDLQERSDLWKWDIAAGVWTCHKLKISPGPLHSHSACRLPSCMILFGGEHDGHVTNDVWKFSFATETWEKLATSTIKPKPRSESVAFVVSELLLNDNSSNSLEAKNATVRSRTCNSSENRCRHSAYFTNNRIGPSEKDEKTYIFEASNENYVDGSDEQQTTMGRDGLRSSRKILHEITKLSQMNIARLNNKCNYSVLTGCTDSTECLLKQHSSPAEAADGLGTPTRGAMVKSKSAYVIKKKDPTTETPPKKVEFGTTVKHIPHEPLSVPNFSTLTLPTPILTPVEAARLVFLDTDDENELGLNTEPTKSKVKRGESYSSHLGYVGNPLYQHLMDTINSDSEAADKSVSSTSDYASIETVNRIASEKIKEGPFGFCNPNYLGPDIKTLLHAESEKKQAAKLLNAPSDNTTEKPQLEMRNYNSCLYRHRPQRNPGAKTGSVKECSRASSASRIERSKTVAENDFNQDVEAFVPLYVYVIGGKEKGQVTVFQRPLSIWKLKLF